MAESNESPSRDLAAIPYLSNIAIFLNGLQRLVWSYGTFFLDTMVYAGFWQLPEGVLTSVFAVVNFLVLGVLFGEKALINILPFWTALQTAKNQTAPPIVNVVQAPVTAPQAQG